MPTIYGIAFDSSGTYGVFASNRDTKRGLDEIWYFEHVVEYLSGGGKTKDKFTAGNLPARYHKHFGTRQGRARGHAHEQRTRRVQLRPV